MDLEMEKINKWLFDLIWEEARRREGQIIGTNKMQEHSFTKMGWERQKEFFASVPGPKTNQQIFKGGF